MNATDKKQSGRKENKVKAYFESNGVAEGVAAHDRRMITAIDQRLFHEAYNTKQIIAELGDVIPTLTKTKQLVQLVGDRISGALHPESVTIFLDDEEVGAYVVAFSSDASKTGVELPAPLRSMVLHYEEGLVKRLRQSMRLLSIELTEADFLPRKPGRQRASFLSDHESRTLAAVRSSLLIPIATPGRLHGLISLGRRLSGLPYVKEDKLLLLVLASQIAAFIENIKTISRMPEEERVARELEQAAEVQRRLFPADGLEDDGMDVYGDCLPAHGVGGDYYDYFAMDECHTRIAVADVAGKGIAAALLMASLQASLHCQLSSEERSLAEVVSLINHVLQRSTDDQRYATFFLAEFNKAASALTYVNAGHNPPMLVRAGAGWRGEAGKLRESSGSVRYLSRQAAGARAYLAESVTEEPMVRLLTKGGPIIGAFFKRNYEQETIQLQSGDLLVIYTDGVTETVNAAGMEFGEEKLRSILVESLQLTAREVAEKVVAKVLEWRGQAPQHDDLSLIVMKVK
jgi:phosphoserine phosphatase RsbU/P